MSNRLYVIIGQGPEGMQEPDWMTGPRGICSVRCPEDLSMISTAIKRALQEYLLLLETNKQIPPVTHLDIVVR